MPVELPQARSFKAFAGEYVMIVLSIVTALALESGVRSYHQSREAREAARNLDTEIAANIVETRTVIAHNKAQVDKVKRLKETLLADIKAGMGDKEAIRHTMNGQDFGLSLVTPSLQREAWDVAVANQALSFMPPERLQPYARQYAQMRDVQLSLSANGSAFLDLPRLADTFSDFEMSELTARSLYRALTQLSTVYETNVGIMRALEKLLVDEQRRSLKLAKG